MSLSIAHVQLLELLHDFYKLSGIRVVIFDDNFQELLTYPETHSDLCTLIRTDKARIADCETCNYNSFIKCKQSGKLVIYHCHSGLIEATVPIKSEDIIIGYMMFGQITDKQNKKDLADTISDRFQVQESDMILWQKAVQKIKYKSISQINAASKILEACTYYILQKDLVLIKHDRLIDKINKYIEENLPSAMTAQMLAEVFHISRTRIYEITSEYLGIGIAEYIKKKRLERAKSLLSSSTGTIVSISEAVGFTDYSYFTRVFKKEVGLTPKEYREQSF